MRYSGVVLVAGPGIYPGWRRVLEQREPAIVFHTGLGRTVGYASQFELDADDRRVWAWLDVDFGVEDIPKNCAGILAMPEGAEAPQLVAVMLSNLSHEQLASLTGGMGEIIRE